MSRRSPKQQRLRLFELGNNRCPICLTSFTERDVKQGTKVTLEHVPPKSFSAGGIAMCLTCSDCNHSASCVEQAAVEARREPKVQMEMPGLPAQTGYVSVDASGHLDIRMSKPRVSTDAISKVLSSCRPPTITFKKPNSRYISVPWLKAAYLSVFSLLGVHGYRYAEGEAIERVRNQIMKPADEIIRHFAFEAPAVWQERDCIVMNRKQPPCWTVKMGDCIVFLPRSWDQSLYEWIDRVPLPDGKITTGSALLWYPVKFGRRRVASIAFRESYSPENVLGENLFGMQGRVTQGDKVTPFVLADYRGQEVTVIVTENSVKTEKNRRQCSVRDRSAT